jgi:magnesium-transporting ATPase (P-type)
MQVPLLLVHGQWSYRRMCKLVLYSFWKNMLFAITNICFGFYSAFSAQVPPPPFPLSRVFISANLQAGTPPTHRRCTTAG